MITIKSAQDIERMRAAGRVVEETLLLLEQSVRVGITTAELDRIADAFIRSKGAYPTFLNYNGYPKSVCISVNDEVVHGIPSADRILMEGDIVTFDTGLIYKGYHSDAARTWGVGKISEEAQKLIDVTRESFFEGIKMAKAGNRLHQISRAIDNYVTPHGYGIVRELTGHGIGTSLHEDPIVPNYKKFFGGVKLKKGMTICVEPMITMGQRYVGWLDDDWTVVTVDGSLAAHYENTIAITDGEPEILTLV